MTRIRIYVLGAALTLGLSGYASAQSMMVQSGTMSGSEAGASASAVTAPTYNFSGNPARQETVSRLTTVAPATAPNVFSSNPCVISASGSVSAMGFGMALGAGVEDRDCTRRSHAALLAQMGLPRAAAEVLCHNSEVRAAMAVAGVPCAADREANTIMPNPPAPPGPNFSGPAGPAVAQPVAARAQQAGGRAVAVDATSMPVVAASAPTPSATPQLPRVRPDWCFTASAAERNARPGAC